MGEIEIDPRNLLSVCYRSLFRSLPRTTLYNMPRVPQGHVGPFGVITPTSGSIPPVPPLPKTYAELSADGQSHVILRP